MSNRMALLILLSVVTLGADSAVPAGDSSGMTLRFELFSPDVARSAAFYREVLGFSVAERADGYTVAESGGVRIGLQSDSGVGARHYFKPELATQRRGLGVEIVLEVADVNATFDSVKKSGHPILSPLAKRPWGATDFRITDPDGYYLRITSR